MRYPYILPSLIAILAICSSCSEDAKYNVNGEEAKTCTANEDCASGRCLKSGKCAPLREEGEVCNRSNPCKESLDCVDGICVKGQNGEPEDKTNACDPECEDGKVCWRSRCLTEDEIHKQNGCLSDDDCKGEKKNKSCLSDGFCGRYLEKGDDCMADERAVCPKNMSCIGDYDSGAVPDITGRFIAGSICGTTNDGRHVISAKLCNRGTKPVSKYLPATFYYYNEAQPDDRSRVICTSYTKAHVGVGECGQVGCEVSKETLAQLEGKKVMVVTNVNELGYASTVECNKDNNADIIEIEFCKSNDIVIIN